MKLFYSATSPYARKCVISLHVTNLIHEAELIIVNPINDVDFRKVNPLGKVPALEYQGEIFADSPLICEFIDSLAIKKGNPSIFNKGTDKYFPCQRIHTQADGILDAAVNTIMESRRETEHSQMWLQRWHMSVVESIKHADVQSLIDSGEKSIATIAWASALGYLDFRLEELNWRSYNRELERWFDNIKSTAWFIATQPS